MARAKATAPVQPAAAPEILVTLEPDPPSTPTSVAWKEGPPNVGAVTALVAVSPAQPKRRIVPCSECLACKPISEGAGECRRHAPEALMAPSPVRAFVVWGVVNLETGGCLEGIGD